MFKKHMTPLGKGGQLHAHQGKGSQSQVLPSRHALSTLTQGNVGDRTMNNYAKSTPMAAPQPDMSGTAMPAFPSGGGYGGGS